MQAHVGASEVQMVLAGLPISWIVEGTGSDENEVRAAFGFAEHVRTAVRTEAAMHDVAAVGDAAEATRLSLDGDGLAGEANVYGRTTGADVLA